MSLYVLIMPMGTFTTTCLETAENFLTAYSNHHVVWQVYESYEHYIEHRYDELFDTNNTQQEIEFDS